MTTVVKNVSDSFAVDSVALSNNWTITIFIFDIPGAFTIPSNESDTLFIVRAQPNTLRSQHEIISLIGS